MINLLSSSLNFDSWALRSTYPSMIHRYSGFLLFQDAFASFGRLEKSYNPKEGYKKVAFTGNYIPHTCRHSGTFQCVQKSSPSSHEHFKLFPHIHICTSSSIIIITFAIII
mmetsp:Transcript_71164/g.125205  ORF Transcript_71164/g.125205 Transcript_71164/m.125205 type:complete len:111 (-) Transcript_71164:376-708(-)